MTLVSDPTRHIVTVTTDDGTTHEFKDRAAAYAAYPELRPAAVAMPAPTSKLAKREERRQAGQRI